jgi:hypothetical protein
VEGAAMTPTEHCACAWEGAIIEKQARGWEVRYQGELFGRLAGSERWLIDDCGRRREMGSKAIWCKALRQWYHLEMPPSSMPARPRVVRKRAIQQVAAQVASSLLGAVRVKSLAMGDVATDEAWITFDDLEEVLAAFGHSMNSALFHDVIVVRDQHPGQPRHGSTWGDRGSRLLRIEVLHDLRRPAGKRRSAPQRPVPRRPVPGAQARAERGVRRGVGGVGGALEGRLGALVADVNRLTRGV